MITLTLHRSQSDKHGTLGLLMCGTQRVCVMGELRWLNNRRNISCIPAGRYVVNYLARSASGKYRDVYHIKRVPGRSGILIHAGNVTGDSRLGLKTHSHGCVLPGIRVGVLANQRAVLRSRKALQAIHAVTGRTTFVLEVKPHD